MLADLYGGGTIDQLSMKLSSVSFSTRVSLWIQPPDGTRVASIYHMMSPGSGILSGRVFSYWRVGSFLVFDLSVPFTTRHKGDVCHNLTIIGPDRNSVKMQSLFAFLIATLMAAASASGSTLAQAASESESSTNLTQGNKSISALPLENGPVEVTVSFELRDIDHIDDDAETIEFTGVMKLSWHDSRQAFDPLTEGTAEKIFQGEFQFNEVFTGWYPQLILVNESGMYEKHGVLLRVRSNGSLSLYETVNAAAKIDLDLRRYPIDQQQLEIVLHVLGFDVNEIVLRLEPGYNDGNLNISVLISSANAVAGGLPDPGVKFEKGHVAIVITDPQVDFLSPKGVTWHLVGKNVTENKTVENIERLMKIAGERNILLFISPHYYFPTDLDWDHGGALEAAMHNLHMFERAGQLDLTGFDGSGSDWMPQYKKYINNGKAYVSSPHKLYGPDSNDTVLQLRKRGIDQIILAGMSANLCTESHMREFMEQGFEVLVVTDAVAAAQVPGYDGGESTCVYPPLAQSVSAPISPVASIAAKALKKYLCTQLS